MTHRIEDLRITGYWPHREQFHFSTPAEYGDVSDKNMYGVYIGMDIRKLGGDEAVDLIVQILRETGKPLTTKEVQVETERRLVQCPDSTVIFLNKLRRSGVIKGERSQEKRSWIWWVD
jgi:hypothetical protein